jgi:hypothetical protein
MKKVEAQLRMEVTYSTETYLDFQRTTRRYIPEGRTLEKDITVTCARNHLILQKTLQIMFILISDFVLSVFAIPACMNYVTKILSHFS